MKLISLARMMWVYNQMVAYGSECAAWQDFANDCHAQLHIGPFSDDSLERDIDVCGFEDYWTMVVVGISEDYNADGSRVD